VIESDGPYDILASQSSNEMYLIEHGFAPGEYLLIENRQKSNFDANLPTGGIIIYHVDENVQTENEETSYPGESLWPNMHYMVRVIQKDGLFQIEKGENAGDANDFWQQGDTLFPSGSEDRYPSSDSYFNGATNITISILTESSSDMRFFVSGISDPPLPIPGLVTPGPTSAAPTPAPTLRPTSSPTLMPTNPTTQTPTFPPFPTATAHPAMALPTLPPQQLLPPTFPPQGVTVAGSSSDKNISAHPALIVLYILIFIASVVGVVYVIRLLKHLREEGDGIDSDYDEDKDLVREEAAEEGEVFHDEEKFEDEGEEDDEEEEDSESEDSDDGDDDSSSSDDDSSSSDDDDSESDSSEESSKSIL